jgi:signal transduction histidine kinase
MKTSPRAFTSSSAEDRESYPSICGLPKREHRIEKENALDPTLTDYLGRLAALGTLAQRESPAQVVSQAIGLTCAALGADYCALFELIPGTHRFVMRHGRGWRSALDDAIGLEEIIEVNGNINHALDSGFMMDGLAPDAGSHLLRFMRSHRVSSGATAAIEGRDGLIGILGIYTTYKHRLTQSELDLLQITANIIGGALAAERSAAEQTRAAALEAARLKSAFLANTTHEIRSPLNVIMGYSELVAENLTEAGDDSQSRYLEAVRRAGRRLLGTVDRIIAYARLECGDFKPRPETVDLRAVVDRLIEEHRPAAEEKGLLLIHFAETDDANVQFDPQCLEGVIGNPLLNAIKFTEAGGVTVRLYRAGDGQLKLEISDSGIGMNAGYLAQLFEPFGQEDPGTARRYEGAGLGLALSRRYAELNGAAIKVKSAKDRGTTVTIEFGQPPPSLIPPGPDSPKPFGGERNVAPRV